MPHNNKPASGTTSGQRIKAKAAEQGLSVKDFLSSNRSPAPENTTTPDLNNTIAVDSLGSQSQFNIPEEEPDLTAQAIISNVAGESELQRNIRERAEAAQKEKKEGGADITSLMQQIAGVEANQDFSQTRKFQEDFDILQGAIDIESKAIEDRVQSFYDDPQMTQAIASRGISRARRESASQLANLSIAQAVTGRNFDRANALSKQKVAMETAPLKADLEAKKFIFDNNKDSWTAAERAELDLAIKQDERDYDKVVKLEEDKNDFAIKLMTNNAPQSMSNLALEAESMDELLQIPGIENYMLSQGERLDLQLKRIEIAGAGAADIQAAKEEAAAIDKAEELQTQSRLIAKDKLDNFDAVLDNTTGLKVAVGLVRLGRTPIGLSEMGAKADFIGGVEQLISKETIDTLINLKARGGTLGALSDQERVLLQTAASKIGLWRQTKQDGDIITVTGYKVKEASFKKELEEVKRLTERAYINAGGQLPGSAAETQIADDYINKALSGDVGLESQLTESGY